MRCWEEWFFGVSSVYFVYLTRCGWFLEGNTPTLCRGEPPRSQDVAPGSETCAVKFEPSWNSALLLSGFGGEAGHEAHEGVLGEIGTLDFTSDGAIAQDEDAAAEAHDFGEFGGNGEQGDALAGEFIEEVVDLGFCTDIDTARGFIHDEDFALAGEPFGESDFLLVTAAQAADTGFE